VLCATTTIFLPLHRWEILTTNAEKNVSERERERERAQKYNFFFLHRDPIYLQSVIIHSANGGKGEGCLVEEYSVALLC
jgi:hypothetical protein